MLVDKSYQLLDKGPVRILILILALGIAGSVMWDQPNLRLKPAHFLSGKGYYLFGQPVVA